MLFTKASLSTAPPGVVQLPMTAQCTVQPAPVFLPPPPALPNSENKPPQEKSQHLVSMSKCQSLCQGTLSLHFIYVNISFHSSHFLKRKQKFPNPIATLRLPHQSHEEQKVCLLLACYLRQPFAGFRAWQRLLKDKEKHA